MKPIHHLIVLAATLSACGTQDSKSAQTPVTSSAPSPTQVIPSAQQQPQYLPAPQAPVTPNVDQIPVEDTAKAPVPTPGQDPFGVPYDPTAEVPYSPDYTYQTTSQYNPMVPAYYSEVENYLGVIGQPIATYVPGYQLPLLYDRYCQHRAFLNYYPSFRGVNMGRGPWDRHRYDRVRNGFDRSQRWVNAELFQLIQQSLDSLRRRNYYSSRGLEDRIHDAIRRRDHRLAAQLHDDLLREASEGYGRNDRNDRNDRDDRRDGNDRGRGRNDGNDGRNDRDDQGRGRNDDGRDRNNGRDRNDDDRRGPGRR